MEKEDALRTVKPNDKVLFIGLKDEGGSAVLCCYSNGVGIGRLIEGVRHLLRFLCAYPREGIVGRCHLNGLVCHRGQEVGIHHAIQ